jgi:hypothetical protein
MAHLTGLPQEAQWEYAARAGAQTPFSCGDCLLTDDQVSYNGNYPMSSCIKGRYREKPIAVSGLSANAWGLHDMHGNVWESRQHCVRGFSHRFGSRSQRPFIGSEPGAPGRQLEPRCLELPFGQSLQVHTWLPGLSPGPCQDQIILHFCIL